jgi:hypothetical protein
MRRDSLWINLTAMLSPPENGLPLKPGPSVIAAHRSFECLTSPHDSPP